MDLLLKLESLSSEFESTWSLIGWLVGWLLILNTSPLHEENYKDVP